MSEVAKAMAEMEGTMPMAPFHHGAVIYTHTTRMGNSAPPVVRFRACGLRIEVPL
jgi:hypothetical protein